MAAKHANGASVHTMSSASVPVQRTAVEMVRQTHKGIMESLWNTDLGTVGHLEDLRNFLNDLSERTQVLVEVTQMLLQEEKELASVRASLEKENAMVFELRGKLKKLQDEATTAERTCLPKVKEETEAVRVLRESLERERASVSALQENITRLEGEAMQAKTLRGTRTSNLERETNELALIKERVQTVQGELQTTSKTSAKETSEKQNANELQEQVCTLRDELQKVQESSARVAEEGQRLSELQEEVRTLRDELQKAKESSARVAGDEQIVRELQEQVRTLREELDAAKLKDTCTSDAPVTPSGGGVNGVGGRCPMMQSGVEEECFRMMMHAVGELQSMREEVSLIQQVTLSSLYCCNV